MRSAEAAPPSIFLDEVIRGRRSVRRYLPLDVPEEDLAAILDAACWAPSPHNSQPWRFVVLRDRAVRERLALAMGRHWQADLAGDGRDSVAIAAEVRKSHHRLTGAPVVVIACLCEEGLDRYPDRRRQQAEQFMAAQSLGAAVQTLMLAAYARGLGTCWMCAPVFCPEVVVETLRLSPELVPQILITLGYPADWPVARARRPASQLVVEIGC